MDDKRTRRLTGHQGAVNDLAICDDEGLLMSVSGDTTLLVWGYGNRLGSVTAASTSNSGGGRSDSDGAVWASGRFYTPFLHPHSAAKAAGFSL